MSNQTSPEESRGHCSYLYMFGSKRLAIIIGRKIGVAPGSMPARIPGAHVIAFVATK
jgi:hypothetical protein